jgi:hypothetical protein
VRSLQQIVGTRAHEAQDAPTRNALTAAVAALANLSGSQAGTERRSRGGSTDLKALNGELARVLGIIQESDSAPTTQAIAAVAELKSEMQSALTEVRQMPIVLPRFLGAQ